MFILMSHVRRGRAVGHQGDVAPTRVRPPLAHTPRGGVNVVKAALPCRQLTPNTCTPPCITFWLFGDARYGVRWLFQREA